MKKNIILLLLLLPAMVFGRGLRHSVCQVTPEYSEQERSELREMALRLSRSKKSNEAHFIQTIIRPNYYGSGVVIAADQPCILTTYYTVGYAKTATITVYLHDKTLRYRGCQVLGTDTLSNLALIALPESEDLDPLPIVETPIEDGDDIASAGYSTLGEQASWQLVKGTVSNAYLRRDGCLYIQHTAPINVGMAGGPLLQKTDSGHVVVGINVGKIGSRDEVAMAVPVNQIHQALTADKLHSAEQQLETLRKLVRDSDPETIVQQYRDSVRGLDSDISMLRQNFFYNNFLSAKNMETGFGLEMDFGSKRRVILGMQILFSLAEGHESGYFRPSQPIPNETVFAPMAGMYFGYQLPIRVGAKHVIIPRITAGVNAGPCFTKTTRKRYEVSTALITTDPRIGFEYHYQADKFSYIIGVDYTAHPFFTGAELNMSPIGEAGKTDMIPYFNHGIGIHFAIGFFSNTQILRYR